MAIYRVQAPTGQVLRIEGPEDATEQELEQAAQEYMAAATRPADPQVEPEGLGVGEAALGAGEAALTAVTGATGGAAGMIGGTLQQAAKEAVSGEYGTPEAAERIEQRALEGMQALTYAPRTGAGQQILETVGEVAEPIAGAAPGLAPLAETAAVAGAARAGAAGAGMIARERIRPVNEALQRGADAAREKLGLEAPGPAARPGDQRAAGAAVVPMDQTRSAMAERELPVPVKLTEGQRTREFEQQRFERETAKDPDIGEPIRQRFREQNEALEQNLDEFIDQTGAKLTDVRGVGEVVDEALRSKSRREKDRIRALYKEAEKSGEMEEPVTLAPIARHLDENESLAGTVTSLPAIRKEMIRLGAAEEAPDGTLIPKPVTLERGELLRSFVNDATDSMDSRQVRQAKIIKDLYDKTTEGAGGDLYRRARKARTQYARQYENVGLIKQLLGTKRGTDDRAIALENVVDKSIISPSTPLDMVRHLRRLLQTEGEKGKQAWRELQGGVLRHIRDQALKGVTTNEAGNRILSPSQLDRVINQLDRSGKLEFVFGKKGAEQLQVLNDVAKIVATAPPGVVNHSNTATVLAGMMDVVISGTAGVPAPVASAFRALTSSIKDAKLRAEVKKALGE